MEHATAIRLGKCINTSGVLFEIQDQEKKGRVLKKERADRRVPCYRRRRKERVWMTSQIINYERMNGFLAVGGLEPMV